MGMFLYFGLCVLCFRVIYKKYKNCLVGCIIFADLSIKYVIDLSDMPPKKKPVIGVVDTTNISQSSHGNLGSELLSSEDMVECVSRLADYLNMDNMSIITYTQNANNNILLVDAVLYGFTGKLLGMNDMLEFKIDWDHMFDDNTILPKQSDRDEYKLAIYYLQLKTITRQIYYIDMKKIKFKSYKILFAIIEYIIKPKRFDTTKPLLIVNNIDVCLKEYVLKFYYLLERYAETHYYWFLSGGCENARIRSNKLAKCCHNIWCNLRLIVNEKRDISALLENDLVKYELLSGESLETIIRILPLHRMLLDFVNKIRNMKHIGDLALCYKTGYAIAALDYSLAKLGRVLIKILMIHRRNPNILQELSPLNKPNKILKIFELCATIEQNKYETNNENAPIYHRFLIDIAHLIMLS